MKILFYPLPLADDNPSENADISNEKGINSLALSLWYLYKVTASKFIDLP